jgi:diguanylate cyclase (GGDEF)-like protein
MEPSPENPDEGEMKVLIAEDDATTRFMLEATLARWGYEVVATGDGMDAWRRLVEPEGPPLAVLDWMMPGMDGLEICRNIREMNHAEEAYKYLILLTSKRSTENIVAGLEAGADDYVSKPFNVHELQMRIRTGKRIIELQERLKYTASHDPLTGLLNRGALFRRMKSELSRARREKINLCIALIDMDHFKSVNDNHGHQVGDEVLRETATRIKNMVRNYDGVGRYGGEEMLVVAPGINKKAAMNVFERLRRAISETPFQPAAGKRLPVTISIGLAFDDGDSDIDDLIRRADAALYRAKKAGRNRLEIER